MMKKFFLLFIIPLIISAQSRFIDNNTNGFFISVDYYSLETNNSFGAIFSYSLYGIYDFGISYSNLSFKNSNLTEKILSPNIGMHFLRDHKISFAVNISYHMANFDGEQLKYQSLSEEGYGFIVKSYGSFQITQDLDLIPMISYNYVSSSTKYSNHLVYDEDYSAINLDLSFILKTVSGLKVSITPRSIFRINEQAFGVNIGLVLPN
jgi:hypothetical protein